MSCLENTKGRADKTNCPHLSQPSLGQVEGPRSSPIYLYKMGTNSRTNSELKSSSYCEMLGRAKIDQTEHVISEYVKAAPSGSGNKGLP